MEIRQYLEILGRWLWLIVLCAILAAAGSYFFSQQQPRVYAASTVVLLDSSRATSANPAYADVLVSERLARTYAQLFTNREAVGTVVTELGYQPGELAIQASPQRDTTLLTVRVESSEPEAAAYMANRLPQIVSEQLRSRQVERYSESRQGLEEQVSLLESEIEGLRRDIDALERLAGDEGELARLRGSLSLKESSYESALQNLSALTLAEVQSADVLAIVEPAVVPTRPIRPRVLVNTLLAALVGILVGSGAAFLIEYFDNTVKEDSPLDNQFGLSRLATIAQIQSGEDGVRQIVTEAGRRDTIAENYRMLRTNVRFSLVDRPRQTLLVTSPGPTEGKSTTAANLAVVLAQAGHSTILIDADLRRPVQHQIFKLPNAIGLTNALVEPGEPISHYLRETGMANLRLMSSGPIPPNPSELLGSLRMKEVMAELEEEAEYVVLDTPPVLVVTDSALIASSASGVILVIRAGLTTNGAVEQAVEQLRGVKAHLLGAVVNDARPGRGGRYQYYYHEYYEQGATDNNSGWRGVGGRLRSFLPGAARE